jgi:hypothetical protein
VTTTDAFKGTAWYYARYRPGYPEAFIEQIRVRLVALVGLLLLAFGFAPGAAQDRARIVIRHVTVIDGTGAPPKVGQDVVILDGRIAAMGTRAKAPAGARVVDGTGKFLIPGLWDMHAHVSYYPGLDKDAGLSLYAAMFLANGVTGIRDMAGYDAEWLLQRRREIESGARLGPQIIVTGRALDGPNPTDAGKWPVGDAAAGREAVRALKRQGAEFVKVYDRLPREAYFAIAEECRRLGMPFAGHVPLSVTAGEAAEAGQGSIEHLGLGRVREACYLFDPPGRPLPPDPDPARTKRLMGVLARFWKGSYEPDQFTPEMLAWLRSSTGSSVLKTLSAQWGDVKSLTFRREEQKAGNRVLHYRAEFERMTRHFQFVLTPEGKINWLPDEPRYYDAAGSAALFRRFVQNRIWHCPTLTALRGTACRDDPALRNDPRLKYVTPRVRRMLEPKNDVRLREFGATEWEWLKHGYRLDVELVGRMRKAGVQFLAGTDAITDLCIPGFSLHDELALLVRAGLTPMEALQAATRNPARFLGREKGAPPSGARWSGTIAPGRRADLVLLDANPLVDIRNTVKIRAVVVNGRLLDRSRLDTMLSEVAARAARAN